ncbi:unnamed protein product [Phytophthora lilii]|uniref:Unnamed protein product n=1 Tax=Phytophthora lilii TaxID=2077276 RepID=A0A9W6U6D0_9STRA|nr:unnamed protein product [Phytophthora lilii]
MKQDGCAMWKPVEIAMDLVELPATRPRIVAVEAGHLAAYALDADQGNLYSWGTQIFGQLGHGEDLDPEVTPCNDIAEAEGGGSINGEEHSTRQHDVENHHEEDEDDAEPQPKIVIVERTPKLVEGLVGHAIVKISAGNHFVVAVTTNGSVFSWGRGCFGQLGNGDFANVSTPAQIDALKAYTAVDIAAGLNHVLGVFVVRDDLSLSNQQEAPDNSLLQQYEDTSPSERTVVMVWGRGKHGCLGLGGSKNEVCPCESTFFRGLAPAKVAAGADHSLVMCRVGARTFLYAFGGNQLGQLGIASGVDHVDMPSFLDEFVNVHVASIGAGSQYSAALTGMFRCF